MNKILTISFLAIWVLTGKASAQTFSAEDLVRPQKAAVDEVRPVQPASTPAAAPVDETIDQISQAFSATRANSNANSDNPLEQISEALKTSSEERPSEKEIPETEDIFIPEGELYRLDTPTLDGSVRGGQAFVEVDEKGRMKKVSNIFLYYDQFKILNYLADTPSCDVRFNVLSNLDQKINRLDIKLVWPDLTTTLSFSDVQPNTQTYYNYSLLGKGCYNMDKAPNIIVNRCRVKGMTSAECANKLVWLTK